MEFEDYKFFIENDNNPFILFNSNRRIVYLNTAAEFLLGKVSKQTLYDLTISLAPKDYGSKMTHIDLKYDDLSFYGVTVGYKDDEYIGIHLYQRVKNRQMSAKELSKYILTDINALLETSINLLNIKNSYEIRLITDLDIPDFRISQNDFFKIMRKCFETFSPKQRLDILLKLKVGESVVVKNERCHLVKLEMKSKNRDQSLDLEIEHMCEELHIDYLASSDRIRLIIPMIM